MEETIHHEDGSVSYVPDCTGRSRQRRQESGPDVTPRRTAGLSTRGSKLAWKGSLVFIQSTSDFWLNNWQQASLSRSNPRSFWGYTSNLITIKFPGFYPKPTLVNALWCFAGLISHTVSIFEHTLLCIKGQSILHVKKGSDSEYFWLRGSHTVSVAPPKLSCCVPKAVTENI